MKEAVLLLHGFLMNRHAMGILGLRLRLAGYADHALTYHTLRDDSKAHLAALLAQVEDIQCDRLHLIGHSMGGVMILKLLEHMGDSAERMGGRAERRRDSALLDRVGRVVLLGAPLSGCEIAQTMARHSAGLWVLGRSVDLWHNGYPMHVPEGLAVGSIAGNRRFGMGAVLNTLSTTAPNDGVVRVDETRLPGLADHIVMPVSHSGMLVSQAVARQCLAFLANARFQRP